MNRPQVALVAALPLVFAAGWVAGSAGTPAPVAAPVPAPMPTVPSTPVAVGEASLFFRPFNPGGASEAGSQASLLMARCLQLDRAGCEEAIARYRQLEAVENFGGEYTALRWVAEFFLADEPARAATLKDVEAARFHRVMSQNNWEPLRTWLGLKYDLRQPAFSQSGPSSATTARWVDEYIRFNDPYRRVWEHSDEVEALLELKPGMAVADIGAGSGFFTFRFAERVGPTGKAYGVELDERHLAYMEQVKQQEGLTALEVVKGSESSTGLAEGSVDVIFMCSTYQSIYAMSRAPARRAWIESLKAALRPGGRIVISENTPDGEIPDAVPYRGISISRALVVPQLQAFGFKVVSEAQFVPQRYLLVIEEAAP